MIRTRNAGVDKFLDLCKEFNVDKFSPRFHVENIKDIFSYPDLPASVELTEEDAPKGIEITRCDDIEIARVIPITIDLIALEEKQQYIGTIYYVFFDFDDAPFVVFQNFIIENEMDYALFQMNPISSYSNFINKMLICQDYINSLVSYNSDFQFYRDGDRFMILGTDVKDKGSIKRFFFNSRVFYSLDFILHNINAADINDSEDFSKAVKIGAASNMNPYTISRVKDILSVDKLAVIDKREKSVALVMTIKCDTDLEDTVPRKILATFILGMLTKIPRRKVNAKIETISNEFAEVENEYICEYMFDGRLDDKEYLVLRCKNKDLDERLFLMDDALQMKIAGLIEQR